MGTAELNQINMGDEVKVYGIPGTQTVVGITKMEPDTYFFDVELYTGNIVHRLDASTVRKL